MNDRKLKIAVVCPAYNCEKTLAEHVKASPKSEVRSVFTGSYSVGRFASSIFSSSGLRGRPAAKAFW